MYSPINHPIGKRRLLSCPNRCDPDQNIDGIVPPDWVGAFDMANNEGTIEHLINPINGFQVAHELLKPGGVARHSMPLTGCWDHGLFHPTSSFYLAMLNQNRSDCSMPARRRSRGRTSCFGSPAAPRSSTCEVRSYTASRSTMRFALPPTTCRPSAPPRSRRGWRPTGPRFGTPVPRRRAAAGPLRSVAMVPLYQALAALDRPAPAGARRPRNRSKRAGR